MSYITLSNEIDAVYTRILSHHYRSIAITSSIDGEGVTSMVLALSKRILLAGQSVLVVDFNSHRPFFQNSIGLPDYSSDTLTPSLIADANQSFVFTGVCFPKSKKQLVQLRRPGELEKQIELWLADFDFVIFDTTPLSRRNQHNIPAQRIAAAADTCVMMAITGVTTELILQESLSKLERVNANLTGLVLNDKHYPKLQDELVRVVNRMPNVLKGIKTRIHDWIKQNKLLGMDV